MAIKVPIVISMNDAVSQSQHNVLKLRVFITGVALMLVYHANKTKQNKTSQIDLFSKTQIC